MSKLWPGAILAMAATFGVQSALAQASTSCPAGEVMQGSDPSGKNLQCVPLPPPVDVSGLQAQIDAEKSAREGMDVILQDAIDELRAGGEESLAGTYAVTGSQICTSNPLGFTDTLQPIRPPAAPPPTPENPFPQTPTTFVSTSMALVSGTYTLNGDGSGVADLVFHTVSQAGIALASFGAIGSGGSMAGTVTRVTGAVDWSVTPDGKQLVVDSGNQSGTTIKGGNAGTVVTATGSPNMAGLLGKDRRIIVISQVDMVPEQQTFTSPSGQQNTVGRVCARERLLRRM
jgi:hypothetical protein